MTHIIFKKVRDAIGLDKTRLEPFADGIERACNEPGKPIEYTIMNNGTKLPHDITVRDQNGKYILDIISTGEWMYASGGFGSYRVGFGVSGLLVFYVVFCLKHENGLRYLTQDIRTYVDLRNDVTGLTQRAYAEGFTAESVTLDVLPMVAARHGSTSVIDHLIKDNKIKIEQLALANGGSYARAERQRAGKLMGRMGYAHLETTRASDGKVTVHWAKHPQNLFF